MHVRVLNFKSYPKGAMLGFFDLGYGGMVIKGCRLLSGNNGYWIAYPSRKGEKDGEVKYFDHVYLARPESDHVCAMVVAELQMSGELQSAGQQLPRQEAPPQNSGANNFADDDIPF